MTYTEFREQAEAMGATVRSRISEDDFRISFVSTYIGGQNWLRRIIEGEDPSSKYRYMLDAMRRTTDEIERLHREDVLEANRFTADELLQIQDQSEGMG